MTNPPTITLNFQQYIQFLAIADGFPFFSGVVHVLFDDAFYQRTYPDVAAAIAAGQLASGFDHFVENGVAEGRLPSAFYDEDLYLLSNPDVHVAVLTGALKNGLMHFAAQGFAEGRDALGMLQEIGGIRLSQFFDEGLYLKFNPDVRMAVQQKAFAYGFEHFFRNGIQEGREASLYYNEQYYLSQNADVAAAIQAGILQSGLQHYLQVGHRENRIASLIFDPNAYLAAYADVAAAVQRGEIASAFEHYIEQGVQEGRFSSQLYEEAFYLANNPDVAAAVVAGAFISGYAHFLAAGMKEGRSPSRFYQEANYLAANADVKAAVEAGAIPSGLEHYIRFGRLENRLLAPEPVVEDFSGAQKGVWVSLQERVASLLNLGPNFKLMPVGDSITEGWDASAYASDRSSRFIPGYRDGHEGYRLDLWQKFQEWRFPVDFVGSSSHGPNQLGDRDHYGIPGISIDGMTAQIGSQLQTHQPDVILLMLGTNSNDEPSDMLAQYDRLLNTILSNNAFTGHILVGSIAPARPDSVWNWRNRLFDGFNAGLPNLVTTKNQTYPGRLTFVDVGSPLDEFDDMAALSVDNGLHPNQQGYAKMADAWFAALQDLAIANTTAVAAADVLIGSAFDDVLIGDARDNRLQGGGGNDFLTGGGGADTFVLASLSDGLDTIMDFSDRDRIEVLKGGFPGDLAGGFAFVAGANPMVGSDRPTFLYNTTTGLLRYDQDGVGSEGALSLLVLQGAPSLSAEQIVLA